MEHNTSSDQNIVKNENIDEIMGDNNKTNEATNNDDMKPVAASGRNRSTRGTSATATKTSDIMSVSNSSNNSNDNNNDTVKYPQMDFPYTFYKFINELSVSHPHIITWSDCGNYFKIDRNNTTELPKLIRKYFQHSVYQSLRRQMNMYGFHLTDCSVAVKTGRVPNLFENSLQSSSLNHDRHTNWWGRRGGHFNRDHPDLNKVRPRRRCEDDDASVATVETSKKKQKPKCHSSTANNRTSTKAVKELLPSKIKSKQMNETKPLASNSKLSTSVVRSTNSLVAIAPIDTNNVDKEQQGVLNDDYATVLQSHANPIVGSFPHLLHEFISQCAQTHPTIVQWNPNHTGFNVEIHHPELPSLLLKYFQHCNYSSLRRQLNFYGFRRDTGGFYRNEDFSEGNYSKITSRACRDREKRKASRNEEEPSDDDALSSIFDHDLSTYDTLKNDDDISIDQMDSHELNCSPHADSPSTYENENLPKYKVLEKVYVRDKDGVMYIAVIRRILFGPQYHRQIEMGLVDTIDEAQEKLIADEQQQIWHYFVHFDHWNVTFDRWAAEYDVYAITDETTAAAQRIVQEHRALQVEMRKPGVKGKKQFQTIDGASFLREWKKRLDRIRQEMDFDLVKNTATENVDENSQTVSVESSSTAKPRKALSWTKSALSNERKYRAHGLTSKRVSSIANGITIPFALKKILVQQWEYINQCQMMPCLPAPTTIRQALDKYLETKIVKRTISTPPEEGIDDHMVNGENNMDCQSSFDVPNTSVDDNTTSTRIPDISISERRDQEWRDMADGIAMLFDESLESKLLYREELPQLRTMCNFSQYAATPYSELYGCEHLLRLFIRLHEMLVDNLPEDECRPILAKVNDFIRFLHKNHGSLLTQSHRRLNEAEKSEVLKLDKAAEKKRKDVLAVNKGSSSETTNKKIKQITN